MTDINDNNPIFGALSSNGWSVMEHRSNVVLGQVSATDADIGLNGLVTYHVEPGNGYDMPTGNIQFVVFIYCFICS